MRERRRGLQAADSLDSRQHPAAGPCTAPPCGPPLPRCAGGSDSLCPETACHDACCGSCCGRAVKGIAQCHSAGGCGPSCHGHPNPHQHRGRRAPVQRAALAAARLAAAACVLLLMLLPFLPALPGPRGAHAAMDAMPPPPASPFGNLTRLIGNLTYPLDEQLSYCSALGDLYGGIPYDLRHWNVSAGGGPGITAELVRAAAARFTTAGGQKGVALGFYGGTAYVLQPPKLPGLGHHVNILFTYMLVMLDLQRQYGARIPDLEFVVGSSDKPLVLTAAEQPGRVPPVMRFCSSREHADIRIPIFHFYTKKYTQTYLANAEALAAAYPWERRVPVVFGRFSRYYRHIHPNATSTLRRGARNASICRKESTYTLACPVRTHFMEWAAARHPGILDVRSGPRVSTSKHAAFKYLLHLDGQALSSRLEQLMPLRSLIIKEESGYTAFYYHLVRPYEHYVPFWRAGSGPEDVVAAREWALAHDDEAQRIAAAAQSVALRFLTKRARSCFWLRLFQAYASLQAFAPSPSAWPAATTVESYLRGMGRTFEGGRHLHRIEA